MKKIGIASDHAGYEMKEFLVGYLNAMGYEVLDFGAHSPESVDYADFAHPLAEAIEKGEFERGIALDEAVKMLDAYFAAEFEGGRHIARIAKMPVAGCK